MRESRRGGLRGDHAFQVISLRINGKQVELDQATPLLDYLAQLGVDPRSVAVEHNGEIVERDHHGEIMLRAGDVVEIVRMVGGGGFETTASPST
jgi:sulfur carrier protein